MSTKSLLVKIITFISMQPEKHVPEANDIYILNKLERCDSLNSECVFNWSASFEGNNTWLIWHGRRIEVLWKKIFPDRKKALKYQHFGLLMIFRNFFFWIYFMLSYHHLERWREMWSLQQFQGHSYKYKKQLNIH